MNPTLPQRDVYTVSRLNTEVKMVLEGSFPLLWVEGEISNLSQPSSGHRYFTLKDPHAGVQCALFRNRGRLLNFTPANGQQVLMRVRVTLYDVRGSYQLTVEHMEPVGDGLLRRRFEALKAKLDDEGLFAETHKRPLPDLPRRIGVITSPSGAAIRDVVTVLRRRFPSVPVRVYPVPVQGTGAAERIAEALTLADQRRDCDLLILTRGGGSLEDLWSFNEEVVARAIHAASIPIISAVGHEVDVTIADFVADRRAATPSAAAEMAVPDRRDLAFRVRQLGRRLAQRMQQSLSATRIQLAHADTRLQRVHPRERMRGSAQRVDELELRLRRRLQQRIDAGRIELKHLAGRLQQRHPRRHLDRIRERLMQLERGLDRTARRLPITRAAELAHQRQRLLAQSPRRLVQEQRVRLAALTRRLPQVQQRRLDALRAGLDARARELNAISPLATLDRGYAIARRGEDGTILRAVADIFPGDAIEVRLGDGVLDCTVDDRRGNGE